MHTSILRLPSVALVSMTFVCGLAAGQQTQTEEAHSTENLQKATQNPVASMISVPFQNNSNFGIGPYGRIQNVLNIQPVIPVKLTPDLNLIVRWVAPIVYQPAPGTANLQVYGINVDTPAYFAAVDLQKHAAVGGIGDMAPSFFLTPAKAHKMIFAAGPMLVLPTATSMVLGQGKFSMGPSILTLVQPGHWTVGALVSNVWSVAGDSSRSDVNQMSFQYFVNYNLKKGWALSTGPIITANWKGSSDNVWTVPVGGGVSRVMRLGYQPVNIGAQFYGNAVYPTSGSPWSMRLSISLLFPKMPKVAAK